MHGSPDALWAVQHLQQRTEGAHFVFCFSPPHLSRSAQQNALCILGYLAAHAYCVELNSLGAERVARTQFLNMRARFHLHGTKGQSFWQLLRSLNLCRHPKAATSLACSLQSSFGRLYEFSSPTFLYKNSLLVCMPFPTVCLLLAKFLTRNCQGELEPLNLAAWTWVQ